MPWPHRPNAATESCLQESEELRGPGPPVFRRLLLANLAQIPAMRLAMQQISLLWTGAAATMAPLCARTELTFDWGWAFGRYQMLRRLSSEHEPRIVSLNGDLHSPTRYCHSNGSCEPARKGRPSPQPHGRQAKTKCSKHRHQQGWRHQPGSVISKEASDQRRKAVAIAARCCIAPPCHSHPLSNWTRSIRSH